ncbi:MAG: PAS domain S-box protein [Bacteroidetes bacterium]|nr:PAS domain S-box protein [Bacteroidota bacterium]
MSQPSHSHTPEVHGTSASASPAQDVPESEQLLTLFVQHMPAAVAMLDDAFRYMVVSSRWMKDFGLAGQDLERQPHFDVFQSSPGDWRTILERALDGTVQQGREGRLQRRDGSTYWVRWEARPWYQSGGDIGGVILFVEDVTARKKAEEALHAERRFLAAVLDNIHAGVMACDADGTLTFCNEAARDILGMAGEMPSTDEWWADYDLYCADGTTPLPPHEFPLIQALHTGRVRNAEFVVRPRGVSAARHLLVSGQGLHRADGTKVGAVIAMHDITELKAAQADVQTSKDLLASVLSSSLDGIYAFEAVRDAAGELVDFTWILVNERAEELMGRSADALLGARLLEQMPGARDSGLFDAYVEVVETGTPFEHESYFNYDGRDGWFRVTAVRRGDGLAVTFRDITKRKRAEEALRRSEAFLRMAQQIGHIGSWEWDLRTGLFTWSDEMHHIFGLDEDAFDGQLETILAAVHPDDRERVREAMQQAREEPCAPALEYRVVWPDGSIRVVASDGTVIGQEQGAATRLVGTAQDITERFRDKQRIERANAALEQRNRELQDFAYVASHDLQEPLRKVRAFADLFEEDYADKVDAMGEHYLDRIRDAAERMSTLITDLLAFSRIATRAHPFQEVDLNQIAAEVISDLEVRISEVEGSIEVGELPAIEADPTQMRQLLQNLIGNAFKFRRPGVRPVVEVDAERVRGADVLGGDAGYRIMVRDNGIGFDNKFLDRIFTPFQRLHGRDEYEGTGMGLAICRRIVERHHGHITARSTPEAGATFVVTLPVRQPSPQDDSPTAA